MKVNALIELSTKQVVLIAGWLKYYFFKHNHLLSHMMLWVVLEINSYDK